MMTERERDVLLEEMRTLQRLLTMARPGGAAGADAGRLLPPHGLRHQGVQPPGAHPVAQFPSDLGGLGADRAGVPNLGGEATGFGALPGMQTMSSTSFSPICAMGPRVPKPVASPPRLGTPEAWFAPAPTASMPPRSEWN